MCSLRLGEEVYVKSKKKLAKIEKLQIPPGDAYCVDGQWEDRSNLETKNDRIKKRIRA